MERLRRSLRWSFSGGTPGHRKRKDFSNTETTMPPQWLEDERKVRDGTCCFQVKYLGCTEVFESRGMHVCEEALKKLRSDKNHHQRAILYVSGDALRVVDEIRKGLIVDQTIEKVSFCSPVRHIDRGFAYICRDGTSRRWLCHCFLAVKEVGERLSHAVGCAFAVCLEQKQQNLEAEQSKIVGKKEKSLDNNFQRSKSFRAKSLSERKADPQSAFVPDPPSGVDITRKPIASPSPGLARPRPAKHVSYSPDLRRSPMIDRSAFRRDIRQNMSLRYDELPSTLARRAGCNIVPPTIPEHAAAAYTVTSTDRQAVSMNGSETRSTASKLEPTSSVALAEQWLNSTLLDSPVPGQGLTQRQRLQGSTMSLPVRQDSLQGSTTSLPTQPYFTQQSQYDLMPPRPNFIDHVAPVNAPFASFSQPASGTASMSSSYIQSPPFCNGAASTVSITASISTNMSQPSVPMAMSRSPIINPITMVAQYQNAAYSSTSSLPMTSGSVGGSIPHIAPPPPVVPVRQFSTPQHVPIRTGNRPFQSQVSTPYCRSLSVDTCTSSVIASARHPAFPASDDPFDVKWAKAKTTNPFLASDPLDQITTSFELNL